MTIQFNISPTQSPEPRTKHPAYSIIWLVLTLTLGATPTAAQPLQSSDFAYGVRIDTLGGQPVQSVVLPGIVYQHLVQEDLSDLRVFNDAGQPVPHALHREDRYRNNKPISPDRASLVLPLEKQEDGVYMTHIPINLPADSAQLELPASQSMVRVRIESAVEPDGTWLLHKSGVVYNLPAGDSLRRSPAIPVYRSLYRYWRITLDEQAAPMEADSLSLRVFWTPARLLFVPQGPAPYTLAFGSATAEPAGFRSNELFIPIQSDYKTIYDLPLAATDSVMVKLGGETRLDQPEALPWQKIVLWGVMVMGVVLLGWVAVRLLREQKV